MSDTAKQVESVKVKSAKLVFSSDISIDMDKVEKSLNKLRGDMGNFEALAVKHGLGEKEAKGFNGKRIKFISETAGAKLRSAQLITARQAEDIRAFHGAIKALEIIAAYDTRKLAELAKLNKGK